MDGSPADGSPMGGMEPPWMDPPWTDPQWMPPPPWMDPHGSPLRPKCEGGTSNSDPSLDPNGTLCECATNNHHQTRVAPPVRAQPTALADHHQTQVAPSVRVSPTPSPPPPTPTPPLKNHHHHHPAVCPAPPTPYQLPQGQELLPTAAPSRGIVNYSSAKSRNGYL